MSATARRAIHGFSLTALLIGALASVMPQDSARAADDKGDKNKDEPVWIENLDDARALSKKSGRPILADFTGSDWCVWCKKLHKEVFDTASFKTWAKDHVVLLLVDFPQNTPQTPAIAAQNEKLAKAFNIQGYPTVIIMDSTGTKLGEMGYEAGGPDNWIADLKKAADKPK